MKIAILGSHPATKALAPFRDLSWQIWQCSPDNKDALPRVDRLFELHVPIEHKTRPPDYIDWVLRQPHVVMRDYQAMARCPGAVAYPENAARGLFGPFFWSSSIVYMLAVALMELAPAVRAGEEALLGIWGVMQASENEFKYQRPGIQYFIQCASNMGIEVLAPRESRLFDVVETEW